MFYNTVQVVGNNYFDWLEDYVKKAKAKNPYDHIHTKGSVEMCATGQCTTPIEFDESNIWSDPIRWPFRRFVYDRTRYQIQWQGYNGQDWMLMATMVYDMFDELNTPERLFGLWNWIEYIEESWKSW